MTGLEGFGRSVQTLSDLFYVYYDLMTSPWWARLQVTLNVLTGMFGRFGLQNDGKMAVITLQPCHTSVILL